jgi:hypothetical protein
MTVAEFVYAGPLDRRTLVQRFPADDPIDLMSCTYHAFNRYVRKQVDRFRP